MLYSEPTNCLCVQLHETVLLLFLVLEENRQICKLPENTVAVCEQFLYPRQKHRAVRNFTHGHRHVSGDFDFYRFLLYGKLRELARWLQSCTVIGYRSGHYPLFLWRKWCSLCHIKNPLFTKFVRIKMAASFFFTCLWTSKVSRFINR